MTIRLNPEQERVIGQAIQAGLIREPDDVVEVNNGLPTETLLELIVPASGL